MYHKPYDGLAMIHTASDADTEILGLDFDLDAARNRRSLDVIRLMCDSRIPDDCRGYVDDLGRPSATTKIIDDRIRMLSRFVDFSGWTADSKLDPSYA